LLAVPGVEPAPEPQEPSQEAQAATSETDDTSVDAVVEEQVVQDSAPSPAGRPWRFSAFILILVAGLLIGGLATAWLLRDDGQPTPTSQTAAEDTFQPEVLDSSNWRTARPLPTERADMAVASVGLDLYLIGGEVEAGVVNLVDVYETDSHRWLTAAAKPTAVSEATAAVLFGEIYVPGGQLVDGTPTAIVEAFSPTNNAWRPVTPLPAPVAGGLALTDGSNLYLFGGWDGQQYLDGGYVYDPASDAWQALPPMAHARADAAGDAVGDRLFVVGGFDGQQELAVCEYFVVPQKAWSACAGMASGRAGAGASAQGNDSLYVIGGGKEGPLTGGELYDVSTDSWSPFEEPMIAEGSSWYDLGVVAVETHIYALGGRQAGSIVADNYTYIPLIPRTYLPSVGSEG
jgi:N-acetylneuraminic acid mutarotase